MTHEEIIDGNLLIAEFMGATFHPEWTSEIYKNPSPTFVYNPLYPPTKDACINWSIGWLQYHSSWEWLMPVVEKITGLKYETNNENIFDNSDTVHLRTFGMRNEVGEFMVRFNRQVLFTSPHFINATWFAVVDFINWYNANLKTSKP